MERFSTEHSFGGAHELVSRMLNKKQSPQHVDGLTGILGSLGPAVVATPGTLGDHGGDRGRLSWGSSLGLVLGIVLGALLWTISLGWLGPMHECNGTVMYLLV